jgi:ADP-dependent NAD(P)H-hydrate dehydratase
MQTIAEIPRLKTRNKDAHKGSFGRVAIVGGSIGMSGAPALAGQAALRCGAGLVRVAVPKSVLPIVAAIEACYTTAALPEDENGCISADASAIVLDQAEQNDVLAFGPGVSQSRGVRKVLNLLIEQKNLRLIIDADGLNCLAKDPDWVAKKKASVILTPHPGEMKRLFKSLFRHDMPSDRVEQAGTLAEKTGCTVVLKGAGTVVTDGSKVYVNTTGNPGMATAGAGDVLTGAIGALAGQGLDNFEAAVLGVYIHGLAGDIAAERIGQVSLTAKDIIKYLSEAFMQY